MASKTKNRFFILLVAFALANIALHAIINFHFYRIFEKELVEIDKHFIKKDDADFDFATAYESDSLFQIETYSMAVLLDQCCTSQVSYFLFQNLTSFYKTICGERSNQIPVRGSPIA